MEKVITNSSCLITLQRIGHLELLPACFSQIVIPTGVQEEMSIVQKWLLIKPVTNKALLASLADKNTGKGESEAIALAVELGIPLILDDRKARIIAKKMEVSIIGTLSVLLYAKDRGIIPEVTPIIQKLQEVNFYIAPPLLEKVLKEAGEYKF